MRFPKISTKQKGGNSMAFPDVCKTPAPPAPFVPIPYPNIAAASGKMKMTEVKLKSMEKLFAKMNKSSKASSGDEAGTLKGITSAMNKMKTLFKSHSNKIKVHGKKAVRITDHKGGAKLFKAAQKDQKNFEKQLKKECDKLLAACKGKPDQEKMAKKVVDLVAKAARGHRA